MSDYLPCCGQASVSSGGIGCVCIPGMPDTKIVRNHDTLENIKFWSDTGCNCVKCHEYNMNTEYKIKTADGSPVKLLSIRNSSREIVRLPPVDQMLAVAQDLHHNEWVLTEATADHAVSCTCDTCKAVMDMSLALDRLYCWFPDIP